MFYIQFKISPLSLYQLSSTEIGSTQTLTFNQSSYGTGPRALSFGVINSIVKIEVYNGSQLILNKTVLGLAQFNVTEISTRSYAFDNFFSDGQNIKIIFTNVGAITGYIRYDFWDYYISNYTASLATVPSQVGFNNWLCGMNDVSYAGWGIFPIYSVTQEVQMVPFHWFQMKRTI